MKSYSQIGPCSVEGRRADSIKLFDRQYKYEDQKRKSSRQGLVDKDGGKNAVGKHFVITATEAVDDKESRKAKALRKKETKVR